MEINDFEKILDECCNILTSEARISIFTSSKQFENRVREVLSSLLPDGFIIDFNSPDQAFPDIAIGEYGVEVKFTKFDTWRSVANSIQENQRVESVKYIFIVFGKMGGIPEVRWGDYEKCVIHVRTSHVPRFEVEIPNDENEHQSLFDRMHIAYDEFRLMPMSEKMKYIRAYAREIHPNGHLWWIEDDEPQHPISIQPRLYTNLSKEEKTRLRAEAALLCPQIVSSGRSRTKYDDVVFYLLTYRGVVCHQARDLFSAGSVGNPQNEDNIENYICNSLKLLEDEMIIAASELDGRLFEEYWGENVDPDRRISRWLEIADQYADGWCPSKCLFLNKH